MNTNNNNTYNNTSKFVIHKINDNQFYFKNNPFGKIIHNINFYEIEKFNNNNFNQNFFNINPIDTIMYDNLETLKYNSSINDESFSSQFHWGQLKLLLSEIQFLTRAFPKKNKVDLSNYTLVYVGAAPGNHINILFDLFPSLNFILIDKRPFNNNILREANRNTKSKSKSSRKITIINKYLDETLSKELKTKLELEGQEIILISDIRSSLSYPENIFLEKSNLSKFTNIDKKDFSNLNEKIFSQPEINKFLKEYIVANKLDNPPSNIDKLPFNKKIEYMHLYLWNNIIIKDMNLQKEFVNLLTPKFSLLKFRFPYDIISDFDYFNGFVFLPVYGPKYTTECRLYVERQAGNVYEMKKWKPIIHEHKMNYFNHVIRKQYYYHIYDNITGIDHCFDCSSKIQIIINYLNNFQKILPSKVNSTVKQYVNKFTNYINDNNKFNLLQKYLNNSSYKWAINKEKIKNHLTKLSKFLLMYEPFYKYIVINKIYRFSDNKEWFYHNKVGFIKWMKTLFKKEIIDKEYHDLYKDQQRLVAMYLQNNTPYRGLLLYHSLGAGKSIASIAAAELLINQKDVVVMLPASLKNNFINEILKGGHFLYTQKNKWKFFKLHEIQSYYLFSNFIDYKYIEKHEGLWLPYKEVDKALNNYIIGGVDNAEQIHINTVIKSKAQIANKKSIMKPSKSKIKKTINNINSKKSNRIIKTTSKQQDNSKSIKENNNHLLNIDKKMAELFNKKDFTEFDDLTDSQQTSVLEQLKYIVNKRYTFIKYNGLQTKTLENVLWEIDNDGNKHNAFDNKVIIIDEIHNLISKVLGTGKIAPQIYNQLLNANNCKIILLSGTPIINQPFEISLLINLIKGYTKLYTIDFKMLDNLSEKEIKDTILSYKRISECWVNIKNNQIKYTITPENFIMNENGLYTYTNNDKYNDIISEKLKVLLDAKGVYIDLLTLDSIPTLPLPISKDEFNSHFVEITPDYNRITNTNILLKHFIGAISYYDINDKSIFPEINKIHKIEVAMTDLQYDTYKRVREDEIEKEMKARQYAIRFGKDNQDFNASKNIFKVFSRQICNFIFPQTFKRPYPSNYNREVIDDDDKKENDDGDLIYDDMDKQVIDKTVLKGGDSDIIKKYKIDLFNILNKLVSDKKYLRLDGLLPQLSPKYTEIIKNMEESKGTVLVYSDFRQVEGIGLLEFALEANEYAHFKIEYVEGIWKLNTKTNPNIFDKKYDNKRFFNYPLDKEAAQIMLDIFNSNYDNIPMELRSEIEEKFGFKYNKKEQYNLRGKLIKTIMITRAGAEGISLLNVRQVHLMEPYWNNIRIDQVIGRARRLKSHMDLPLEERNIEVFKYYIKFTDEQKQKPGKLKSYDQNMTIDEIILSIANRKSQLNNTILELLKQSAIDCGVFNHLSHIKCYEPSLANNSLLDTYDIKQQIANDKINNGKNKIKPIKKIQVGSDTLYVNDNNIVYKKGVNEFITFGKLSKKKNGKLFIKKLK